MPLLSRLHDLPAGTMASARQAVCADLPVGDYRASALSRGWHHRVGRTEYREDIQCD